MPGQPGTPWTVFFLVAISQLFRDVIGIAKRDA